MIIKDDRSDDQKQSHNVIVVGTDSFLSGWGHACGGSSYAGWACTADSWHRVFDWVASRSDMKRVRVVGNDYRPSSRYCAHFHVYVVDENHSALGG